MAFELSPSRAVAAACVLLPTSSAFAVDYLSADQAARLMFPEADAFETREFTLDAAQLRQLDAQGLRTRSARGSARIARKGGDVLGFVITDDVIGKFELISYAVGVTPNGAIRQVEILAYRESHGHEIRLLAWRRQFVGKTAAAPLRVGEDIASISGATLSCQHVTDGVRRMLAMLALARRAGALP